MSATGQVPNRGRRHPISAVTEARRLHKAGWNDPQIVGFLAAQGVIVSKGTVGRWVKPHREEAWQQERETWQALKAASRGGRPMGHAAARPEFKMARIVALRSAGLSVTAVAKVMLFDFGDELTEHMVRWAIEQGRYPKMNRRKAEA